ncbi:hypothetical protein V6N11_018161 [Hibiscus sabdariffa]|uniref:Uncharacterized protein n=1 Tax=Hibiscus sabdariffa TaxID=183260 RepID=A0ABR2T771_9ROSI
MVANPNEIPEEVELISAYIIKKLFRDRHFTDLEVALMIPIGYLSYMMAELFSLSSTLTVLFYDFVMSHYTWRNVTESSKITTKHALATLSLMYEIFILLYAGIDALDIEKRLVSKSPGTYVGVMISWAGLTQLRGNIIMITNTIIVVVSMVYDM